MLHFPTLKSILFALRKCQHLAGGSIELIRLCRYVVEVLSDRQNSETKTKTLWLMWFTHLKENIICIYMYIYIYKHEWSQHRSSTGTLGPCFPSPFERVSGWTVRSNLKTLEVFRLRHLAFAMSQLAMNPSGLVKYDLVISGVGIGPFKINFKNTWTLWIT